MYYRRGQISNYLYAQQRRKQRQELIKKNGAKCGYCFKKTRKLTIDHIIPLSKGGKDLMYNMILACRECNHLKDNMSIEEWCEYLGWEL